MYNVKSFQYSVATSGSQVVPHIDKIFDHFQNEASSLWKIDPRASNQTSDSFVITPKSSSIDFQIRVYLDYVSLIGGQPYRALIQIDSDSEMTDASDNANYGPSATVYIGIDVNSGTNSGSFLLIETDDTITFMTRGGGTSKCFSHFGIIHNPAHANDKAYGLDGIGSLCDTVGSLFNYARGRSRVKISNSFNEVANVNNTFPLATSLGSIESIGGRVQPAPIVISHVKMPYDSNQPLRMCGVLKYIFKWADSVSDLQVLNDNDSQQSFIVFWVGNGYAKLCPWEYGKPLIN
jgi:hypothetical protein